MFSRMDGSVGKMSWARTFVVAAAAATFLCVAEPLAAIFVAVSSNFSPGCGSGGDPNSCPSHPSDASIYLFVIFLAGLASVGLAVVVSLCMGRHASVLGWPCLIGCSIFGVLLPQLGLFLAVLVDRSQHVSGKPAWEIPLSVGALFGVAWVGSVRWLTNRRARRVMS